MTDYKNRYGYVEILGPSPISDRYLRVRNDDVARYLNNLDNEYLVLAHNLRRIGDDTDHPLDLHELEVLSSDETATEDGSLSLVLEVKG
ncbi:hypothetical protein [Rhizobium laguerreae]|uniref:hypothetical protein n=1 Tax=Rhizobium laguerreae TaxID=1076926 RepID=UPI001C8FEE86|nr:hypothetical protein [Rhizobium laguerreae]MBY3363765.1 hypothetical protein [Rhizobium laguerreae]